MSELIIDVMVEIPKGSRNKYEYDMEARAIRLELKEIEHFFKI